MWVLWAFLSVCVGVALLLGAFLLVMARLGKQIPVEHTATSQILIAASGPRVFEAIADLESHPTWAKGTTGVMRLPDKPGRGGGPPMAQARVRMGRNSFVLVTTRCDPPTLLERTISDDHGPFSGTWLYKVKALPSPAPGREACEVRLTETGRVNHPIPRAMMKYVFGYHLYTRKHLESLAAKFGTHARAHRA